MATIYQQNFGSGGGLCGKASVKIDTHIVVPCYNEEKRLDSLAFLDFAHSNKSIGITFVDDGSSDNTLEVLNKIVSQAPDQLQVLTMKDNSGKAEAVRCGLELACKSEYQFIGYWDADLATPLDAILDFRKVMYRMQDVDIVYGARKMLMGHRIKRAPLRRLISSICAFLARFAIALPVSDTQCGAKLFRNSTLIQNALVHPFRAGWLFDIELFTRMTRQMPTPRRAIYEYPLSEWDEVAGSNIDLKSIIKAGLSILYLILRSRTIERRRFTRPPTHFSGADYARRNNKVELPMPDSKVAGH
ncbi:MAG: glycosyltransferase [Pseudomonadota bacterium]